MAWAAKVWSRSVNSSSTIPVGQSFVQIGEWRLGDVDGAHASMAHKNGKTAAIFRSDGRPFYGPRSDFSTWSRAVSDGCEAAAAAAGAAAAKAAAATKAAAPTARRGKGFF